MVCLYTSVTVFLFCTLLFNCMYLTLQNFDIIVKIKNNVVDIDVYV